VLEVLDLVAQPPGIVQRAAQVEHGDWDGAGGVLGDGDGLPGALELAAGGRGSAQQHDVRVGRAA
jgi:hypothetical protein